MVHIKKIFIFLVGVLAIFLGGCTNYRELGEIGVVSGIAIDKAKEPGEVLVTSQVLKPSQLKGGSDGGGGGGGKEDAFLNIESQAKTIFSAIRKATLESSKKLFFAHNEIIIFGEEIAKEGIRKYIDFFIRDPENRRQVWIVVSKGKGKDALEPVHEIEIVTAVDLARLVETYKINSGISAVNLQDFLKRLLSKTTAPIATLLEVTGEGENKRLLMQGTAIFKEDKLVGELNHLETRGLLWVLGEVESGIITFKYADANEEVDIEILNATSKIIPEIKDNTLKIKVNIMLDGNLGSQENLVDFTTLGPWEGLEKHLNSKVKNEILGALKKAQKYNTDIFAFGEAVHKRYPEIWKEIEEKWDDYFPTLEVDIVVDSRLRQTGLITNPVDNK